MPPAFPAINTSVWAFLSLFFFFAIEGSPDSEVQAYLKWSCIFQCGIALLEGVTSTAPSQILSFFDLIGDPSYINIPASHIPSELSQQ
jgi:hypothetical protein